MSINATKTSKVKLTFEREAKIHGVVIKGYHTDNGIFNASELMEELLKNKQTIRFIGNGNSRQNGAADSTVKMLVTIEKIMLMHAAIICTGYTLYTDF